ncbi:MAG: NUDIX hydrolase [Anaerolineae bacterium]
MPESDQGVSLHRYALIPRVLIFVLREESVLLLKGAPTKRLWAGKYNGLGGHVERGEDVLSAAHRELSEETGLQADLRLCGIVTVDVEETIGVCLYVFRGDRPRGELKPCGEGTAEWVRLEALNGLPLVEDLIPLLERVRRMGVSDPPFSAHSFYHQGRLVVEFTPQAPATES